MTLPKGSLVVAEPFAAHFSAASHAQPYRFNPDRRPQRSQPFEHALAALGIARSAPGPLCERRQCMSRYDDESPPRLAFGGEALNLQPGGSRLALSVAKAVFVQTRRMFTMAMQAHSPRPRRLWP